MINDRSKPLDWPPKDGYSVDSDDAAGVIDAILAVAAELRTANMMTLIGLQQLGLTTSLDPIRERLGLVK
jgi:hypothetical protein